MDSLFRVVSLESSSSDQYYNHNIINHSYNNSFNNSTTTTSSSSRSPHKRHPQNDEDVVEECFNFFMDEEDFSSSSNSASHHKHQHPSSSSNSYFPSYHQPAAPLLTPPHASYDHFSYSPARDLSHEFFPASSSSSSSSRWASDVLLETARALAVHKDTARTQQLMWMLNELSSPYGDVDQKLSSFFLQALFARMTSGTDSPAPFRAMLAASDKISSFDSTRKTILKFQEVSPWTTFGHVASNGALLDALDGEPSLHIIDISTTFCTQWPTLLEALATRSDDTPHLRLTTVVVNKTSSASDSPDRLMKEVGSRMEKFARLMGVPFKFHVLHHNADLFDLDFADLGVRDDEAVAVNCVNTLHAVAPAHRDAVIASLRRLRPRIVTVVEEEAEMDVGPDGYEFVRGFEESVRWFRVYLEALEESFSRTSSERLVLERAAGRAVMDLLTCPEGESGERREGAGRWGRRMGGAGMVAAGFSDEVTDDVRALLKRYKEGWSMVPAPEGMFLAWKDQPVVWASAWKP